VGAREEEAQGEDRRRFPSEKSAVIDELDRLHAALGACLDVMLRMIPDYCTDASAEPCTNEEHNEAIRGAAEVLYGKRPSTWPTNVRKAAQGKYE
jgi:hypothetical protein